MRLLTYNIEWFASLFDDEDRLLLDDHPSSRHGVSRRQQGEAIAQVLRHVDADGIMVIEAPNTGRRQNSLRALRRFSEWGGLRSNEAVMGFANDTQQEIVFLYDPARMQVRHCPEESPRAPRFDQSFAIDLDVDAKPDSVRFSKPPLELELCPLDPGGTVVGAALRIIGAHLKSKAPYGARDAAQAQAISIANRRKQLAQAIWLRARVDALRARNESVVVMGDLNDGPGLDAYEALFGRSSVEIVLGDDLRDPHAQAMLRPNRQGMPSTARFFDPQRKRYFQALLDYVMVSADLAARGGSWRIWHPFDDAECYGNAALHRALLAASDHFPVSFDFDPAMPVPGGAQI